MGGIACSSSPGAWPSRRQPRWHSTCPRADLTSPVKRRRFPAARPEHQAHVRGPSSAVRGDQLRSGGHRPHRHRRGRCLHRVRHHHAVDPPRERVRDPVRP